MVKITKRHIQGFESTGAWERHPQKKNTDGRKKIRRILEKKIKSLRKRKEGTENADFVPWYGLNLGASGRSAPWTNAKGLASRPRFYDKPL